MARDVLHFTLKLKMASSNITIKYLFFCTCVILVPVIAKCSEAHHSFNGNWAIRSQACNGQETNALFALSRTREHLYGERFISRYNNHAQDQANIPLFERSIPRLSRRSHEFSQTVPWRRNRINRSKSESTIPLKTSLGTKGIYRSKSEPDVSFGSLLPRKTPLGHSKSSVFKQSSNSEEIAIRVAPVSSPSAQSDCL